MKKISMFPPLLSTICALGLMTCVVTAQSLPTPVASWDLNGSGADAIGLSPATVNNVQWLTDTILGTERQVAYLGAGGTIFVPKTSALDLHATGFTLMGWVKSPDFSITPGPNTFFTLIDSQGVSNSLDSAYRLRYNASSLNWQFKMVDAYVDPTAVNIKFYKTDEDTTDLMSENTWNHIALSYDGSKFRAFINGVELNSSAPAFTLESASSYVSDRQTGVGVVSDGATGGYDPGQNGYLADVRIYNQALTTEQIATVPEPSTYALLLLSGAASLWALKRRKS
jgi:hypothetical protein